VPLSVKCPVVDEKKDEAGEEFLWFESDFCCCGTFSAFTLWSDDVNIP